MGSDSTARAWPEVTCQDLDEVKTLQRRNRQTRKFATTAQSRAISHTDPRTAQSLQGISTVAWGCHSAAPATPGHRPPPTIQFDRSCLRNSVGGQRQHRHTGRKRTFSAEGEEGGQRPHERDHPSTAFLPGCTVPGGRGAVRAGPLGVRCSNAATMGRQCRRTAKPAQSPPQEHRPPERSVSSTNHAQRDCRDGSLWGTTDGGLRQ